MSANIDAVVAEKKYGEANSKQGSGVQIFSWIDFPI
jgi:hypothetical protein